MSADEELEYLRRMARRTQEWRDAMRLERMTRAELLLREKAVIGALESWEKARG